MNQYACHETDFEQSKIKYDNRMEVEFDSLSRNVSFARTVVAAFIAPLNPTLTEIADVKTAISEAVTNCVIHAYPGKLGIVKISCKLYKNEIEIKVIDYGIGISDIQLAMEPLYTTGDDMERSGMGFSFMSAFMDNLQVESTVSQGTTVTMTKLIGTT